MRRQAAALEGNSEDDACVGISMLEQVKDAMAQFTADGADDTHPPSEVLIAVNVINRMTTRGMPESAKIVA